MPLQLPSVITILEYRNASTSALWNSSSIQTPDHEKGQRNSILSPEFVSVTEVDRGPAVSDISSSHCQMFYSVPPSRGLWISANVAIVLQDWNNLTVLLSKYMYLCLTIFLFHACWLSLWCIINANIKEVFDGNTNICEPVNILYCKLKSSNKQVFSYTIVSNLTLSDDLSQTKLFCNNGAINSQCPTSCTHLQTIQIKNPGG